MDLEQEWNTSMRPLVWGLVISTAALIGTYLFAQINWLVMLLTFTQSVAVLVYFLHLGIENKPRWNLIVFLFMLVLIIVVIGGSMWVMYNIDYNVMVK